MRQFAPSIQRRTGASARSATVDLPATPRYCSDFDPWKATKGRRMPAGPSPGAAAPAFTLPRDDGGQVSLADFRGRKLVLYFYPKADTPGCTREALKFSALAKDFAAARTALLGVSADPVKVLDKFKRKHGLLIPLASDAQHAMLEAYGAWGEKSMYGRKFLGVLRTTYLIDGEGRIRRVWRNVKVAGHAEDVLAAARAA
jgi:peroxiredoxin Q/BCP